MKNCVCKIVFFLMFIAQIGYAQLPYSTRFNVTRTPIKQWYPTQAINPEIAIKGPLSKKSLLIASKGYIILDPGHGGSDVGTQSISKPRYQEKSLNLVTANFVKGYLEQLGYRVMLTRKEDKFVSLEKRAQIANEKKPDLFISIHYNSAPSSEAQGVEVFFYHSKENKNRADASKSLAQSVLKNVISNTKAPSRGVKHGNFAVIRETKMPAILIEGGFVTNEAELQKLKDPTYLKRLAWGIAKGVDEYKQVKAALK